MSEAAAHPGVKANLVNEIGFTPILEAAYWAEVLPLPVLHCAVLRCTALRCPVLSCAILCCAACPSFEPCVQVVAAEQSRHNEHRHPADSLVLMLSAGC